MVAASPSVMALEAVVKCLVERDGAAAKVFAARLGASLGGASRAAIGAAVAAAWREAAQQPPQEAMHEIG